MLDEPFFFLSFLILFRSVHFDIVYFGDHAD